MALLGSNFTKEENAAGWVESFKTERIAVLQRPFKWWPVKDREPEKAALCRAYKEGLNAALASGELSGDATTVTVTPKPPLVQRRNEFASSEWMGEFGRFGFTGVRNGRITSQPIPQPRDVTTYTVTAPAFAAWLAAQGETPSVHVQAWFDAVGVAGLVVPVAVVNNTPTDESLDDRNLRWLNHYETEERAAKRGAYNRTAAHFEVKAPTLRKAVDKARIDRTERNRAGIKPVSSKHKATLFSGLVTTVKDGKKTTTKQR